MDALTTACREVLGVTPRAKRPLHGGDLSEVFQLELEDGRQVIAKSGPLVDREGRMLRALADAGAPVPQVFGHHGMVLFIEALVEGSTDSRSWPHFGEDLARLHAVTGPLYGWDEDYAFGPVAIPNAPLDDWPTFWAERRLVPFLPHLPAELAIRVERLAARIAEHLPGHPSPGLLHGDLWLGNTFTRRGGRIHLIDPACYHGDGEVDLAMLHLFGNPGPGFQTGYGPPAPGWQIRRAIYSLFPALVHVRLFGAGYHGMAERFLSAAGA